MLAYKNASNQTKVHPSDKDDTDQQLDGSPVSEDDHIGQKKVGKWTPEEDELLRKYAPIYDEKQWRKISNHIPGRSSIQCLHRWTKILKPGLVKGPWTAEEDQKLLTWVRTEGATKWAQAANFIKGRSGKQCRERWFNNLNPDVKKGNWSKMEDELIFELYQKYGTSWSKIAKYLPGRTENAIKNRFYSTLRKLAADKRKNKNEGESDSEENSESPEDTKLIPTLSTPGAAAALGMSSRLYKLLQDTAYVEEQNEQKESSTKDGGLDGGETSNNETPQKTAQDSAEKGKKIVVKKEGKMTVEQTPVTPMKKPRGENEDNDLIFEKFLLSLDESTEEDFLTKELDSHCDSEDLIHFDDLQQKILNYCQDNIHGLAEAFKDIANNDIDTAHYQERRMKSVTQVRPDRNSGSKVEVSSSHKVVQQNIKGIKISAPLVTHISSNKKPNPMEIISSASKSQAAAVPYTKNEDGHGQGYLMMPVSGEMYGHMPSVEGMYNSQSGYVKKEVIPSSHINTLNKLVDNAQEVGTKNNPEGEKRLTFLFQQLHSLEDLLKSTRNELMKLEGAFNQVDDKELEKEIKAMVSEGQALEAAIRPGDEEFEPKKKRKV